MRTSCSQQPTEYKQYDKIYSFPIVPYSGNSRGKSSLDKSTYPTWLAASPFARYTANVYIDAVHLMLAEAEALLKVKVTKQKGQLLHNINRDNQISENCAISVTGIERDVNVK